MGGPKDLSPWEAPSWPAFPSRCFQALEQSLPCRHIEHMHQRAILPTCSRPPGRRAPGPCCLPRGIALKARQLPLHCSPENEAPCDSSCLPCTISGRAHSLPHSRLQTRMLSPSFLCPQMPPGTKAAEVLLLGLLPVSQAAPAQPGPTLPDRVASWPQRLSSEPPLLAPLVPTPCPSLPSLSPDPWGGRALPAFVRTFPSPGLEFFQSPSLPPSLLFL